MSQRNEQSQRPPLQDAEPPDEVWEPLDDQGFPVGLSIPDAVLRYHEEADARRRARLMEPEEDHRPSRLKRWQAEDAGAATRHPGAVPIARLLWLLVVVCAVGWFVTGTQALGFAALGLIVLLWINGTLALRG